MQDGTCPTVRWTKPWSKVGRIYISIPIPSYQLRHHLAFLVTYVYLHALVQIKLKNQLESRPIHFLQLVRLVEIYSTEEEKMTVRPYRRLALTMIAFSRPGWVQL